MIRTVAPVAALLLSVAFLLMGNGLQSTLAPVRAGLEAFRSFELGLLGAGYYAGFAVGCLAGPLVVRRAGHIRAFAAMVAVASAAAIVHPLYLEPYAWSGLRAVTGFCFACLFMIIESWLNEKATNDSRGLIFSVYLVINLSVVTVGQLMLTLDDPRNFSLFALASILVSLAAVPLTMTRSAQPEPPTTVTLRFMHLYRRSPVGLIGVFVVGLTSGAFWTLGPVFASGDGRGAGDAAIFMALGAIAGAVGQWPLGRISDRIDRRKVIIIACAGAAVMGVLMWRFADLADVWRLACVFGFGMFSLPLYALCAAHMNDWVDADGFVEAAGGLLFTFSIGAVLGPLIGSAFMGAFGGASLFAFTAMMHLGLILFTLIRMRQRQEAGADDRAVFAESVLMAQTVAVVEELEPSVDAYEPGLRAKRRLGRRRRRKHLPPAPNPDTRA